MIPFNLIYTVSTCSYSKQERASYFYGIEEKENTAYWAPTMCPLYAQPFACINSEQVGDGGDHWESVPTGNTPR